MSSLRIDAPKRASVDTVQVPLPPSTNNLFRTSGQFRFKTSEYKSWIAVAQPILASLKPPTKLPCAVVVRIVGKVNRARDCDNFLKPIGDCLKSAGVIDDDNLIRIGQWDILHLPSDAEPVVVVWFDELSQEVSPLEDAS
jgi:Holliday junction resolvase RusA-like endonuclease